METRRPPNVSSRGYKLAWLLVGISCLRCVINLVLHWNGLILYMMDHYDEAQYLFRMEDNGPYYISTYIYGAYTLITTAMLIVIYEKRTYTVHLYSLLGKIFIINRCVEGLLSRHHTAMVRLNFDHPSPSVYKERLYVDLITMVFYLAILIIFSAGIGIHVKELGLFIRFKKLPIRTSPSSESEEKQKGFPTS